MNFIKTLLCKYKKIITYFCFSVASTIVDVFLVYFLFNILGAELVFSNTIGVITGFVISFVLSVKYVFFTRYDALSFIIFFATFVLGLIVADYLIALSYAFAIKHFSEIIAFIFSKGVSIVVPFFGLYIIRKHLYILLDKRRNNNV